MMTTTRPTSSAAITSPAHGDLRRALGANAVFSLATGGLLAAAPATVGGWLGVDVDGWLRLVGLALLAHVAILVVAIRADDPRPLGRLNLLAIAPYPALLALVAVLGWVSTGLGVALLAFDGIVVGVIAAAHAVALRGAIAPLGARQAG